MNRKLKEVSLDQALELIQNGYSGKQSDEQKEFVISRIETLQDDDLDKKRVKYADLSKDEVLKYKYDEGDILFSHINSFEKVGKVALYENQIPNLIHGVNILRLKFKKDILPKYAFYFFLSDLSRTQYEPNIKRAINQASLNQRNLKKVKLPVVDFEEQHRIVSKLDALFAEIDASLALIDQNLAQAEALKLSVLDEEFSKIKARSTSLIEIVKIIGGGTPRKSIKKYYEGNIPWASVRDLNVTKLYTTEHNITKEAVENSSTNIIPKGNIIIASRVGLGKVVYNEIDVAINQDLKGLIISEFINREFLYYYFKSIEEYIKESGTGATVKGVKLDFIRNLQVPLPNLAQQLEIVNKLNKLTIEIDALVLDYTKKRDNLEALKSSLLDQAFKGEL